MVSDREWARAEALKRIFCQMDGYSHVIFSMGHGAQGSMSGGPMKIKDSTTAGLDRIKPSACSKKSLHELLPSNNKT
jgi:hypothetical protein